MIDKPEYVNWANVWWILGAEHLTFEEVMGDFRKKVPADWFRGEKVCKDITGKNNTLYWKKKKRSWRSLLCVRENISNSRDLRKKFLPKQNHPYPPPPQKLHGQPHRRWGKRRTWQSAWLVLTNRGSEVSEETWGTSCILYGQVKYVFEREFFYCKFCKGFMDVFYIFTSAWKKTTKCAFEIDFLPCAQPI